MADDQFSKDRKLIQDYLQERSQQTFLHIYSKYNPGLYRIAMACLSYRTDDACDALQETWVTALQKLDDFRGASSLKTWLTGILINKCREQTRRHNGVQQVPAESVELTGHDPLQAVGDGMDLQKQLQSLPPGCREILVLHDLEGYSHHEIGELLNIAEGTSKSQLAYARKLMRYQLTDNE